MTTAATFEHVVKRYGGGFFGKSGITAVRDVSFTIPLGSVFGLLGPNRAGKTTLVKLLLSLSRPTSGIVTRLGEAVSSRRTLARVGYMHENHAFPRHLSASEVLHLYGALSGLKGDASAKQATHLLERVGLADRGREPISQFSKGMVQRLGLAQALLTDPDLLILDEPTEGLDLYGRRLLRETIDERRGRGKSVLLVTHVLSEVEEMCDHLAVVASGSLAWTGLLAELMDGQKPDGGRALEKALDGLYRKGGAA